MTQFVDILVAFDLPPLAFPVVLLIGLAACLDSPGAVFYRRSWEGLGRSRVGIYKCRFSVRDADGFGSYPPAQGDSSIHRIGRIRCKTSLDGKQPQFINVLVGDLGLVGPQPHELSQREFYCATDRINSTSMLTEICCPSQEALRPENMPERSPAHDVGYVEGAYLRFDAEILQLIAHQLLRKRNR